MKQNGGERPGEMSALMRLLKVASLIQKPIRDGASIPIGIAPNDLRILMALGGEGAMAGFELADRIGMLPMNVSRSLDALQKLGLVEPVADTRNRRRKPHQLTQAGWDRFRETEARIASLSDFLLGDLSAADRARFDATLQHLDRRIADWPSPPRAA
ncbi:MarR family winged helix-turn-helix transcriptional regulator [Sphingomonas canadensis]|uniref:MarR family winged helix-turn-helix transcriptional regulator n=1 Tax=Sphingomonas canadensis TaxID=1219257 RepID=A0ABW3H6Y1_9SPHN|nr:MarR family winged helix-turn-helix transcriptional regulator [Sphingomonas canadensis]MCW3835625.1 MarR family winged helix-turn-helix transcriptional regulator [Sphingomonas canadensis]